ncbi:VAN3-binding protein-like isoform X2 [Cucurbita maxima]|uniref:VAN3-binding protein-like isoform X2 n=1 Tax=Cucurbita maxima TaxID=3661 RepID=A0A6J1KXE5_CUCMA|nr:VAN3-binding protein-like isoform X2 [Cucurbita maxima]
MEANGNLSSASAAHPETMDVLSRAWCNFAVQTLNPELQPDKSLALIDTPIKDLDVTLTSDPFPKVEKPLKMEAESIPPWKSNDMKSFIWMQQAMHPELNYSSYFRKKWCTLQFQWKIVPFKNLSIKKWLKEIRQSRKEEDRLQRAEIHAAISVAGVAAALAAIAADTTRSRDDNSDCGARDAAVASAAALVAAQCAQVAQAMGAKREQLTTVIGSAMSSITGTDILTLTAAAATSLKGAATLKARSEYRNKSSGVASVLPIEDNHEVQIDFNLEKSRSTLAKGVLLKVESPNGKYKKRSISIIQNSDTKVILKVKKLNMLKTKQESVVLDMYIELYRHENEDDEDNNEDEESNTCYLIVLTTNKGTFKLDMENDYHKYKIWATTVNQMLMLSAHSFTRL